MFTFLPSFFSIFALLIFICFATLDFYFHISIVSLQNILEFFKHWEINSFLIISVILRFCFGNKLIKQIYCLSKVY